MSATARPVKLNFREKLFLRLYCYPPPGRDTSVEASGAAEGCRDPLAELRRWYGDAFVEAVKDKIVVDIGCGAGEQILGIAKEGARLAIGADMREIYKEAEARTSAEGVGDRVRFTIDPLRNLGESSVDIVYSLNAFEHFAEPGRILEDVYYILKPGGRFFVTFGPPWLAPYGVHHYFMIRYPWAHLLFSEGTILKIRRLYRDDNALRYEEVEGGLNKMTIRKYERYVRDSGFAFERFDKIPVKGLWPLTTIPFINEFFTCHITSVLTKK